MYPCQTLHSNDCSGINKKERTQERYAGEEPVEWTQERWLGEETVEPVDVKWTRECWRWTGRADWTVDTVFMVALADPLRKTH